MSQVCTNEHEDSKEIDEYEENEKKSDEIDYDFDLTEEEYEEYENVILPETMWGEIYYIYCMVKRIITSPKDREFQKYLLKRQIRIYGRWRKTRKK